MGKTEKGEKADNIKASHSASFVDVDAIKNERHTKASSKATVSSIESKGEEASNLKNEKTTEKGEEADNLKDEKATKASSKATTSNKTEKGDKADNVKAEKTTKAVGPKTKKNMDGKSKKNSVGPD